MTNRFILGNLNDDKSGSLYGAATYDEMEYWYGPRDYLLAFGYIQRGGCFTVFRKQVMMHCSVCLFVLMLYIMFSNFSVMP